VRVPRPVDRATRYDVPMLRLAVLFALCLLLIILLADTANLGPLHRLYDFPHGDKAGHFVLLGTLSLLVNLAALEKLPHRNPQTVTLIASGAIVLLITLEELSQLWIPSRAPDWFDLAASYAGIITAACVALRLSAHLRRQREPSRQAG